MKKDKLHGLCKRCKLCGCEDREIPKSYGFECDEFELNLNYKRRNK